MNDIYTKLGVIIPLGGMLLFLCFCEGGLLEFGRSLKSKKKK